MSEEKKIAKIYDIGRVPNYTEMAERFAFPFSNINYLLNGGILDRVTLITSATDNGKTTFSSQILASVIKQGYKVCAFFGEDTAREARDRLYKQITPYSQENMVYKAYERNGQKTNMGEYFLSEEAFQKANDFYSGSLYLYNTMASATVDAILEGFEKARLEHGCRVFLLDNVEQFDFSMENENKAIKDIVIKIRDYAVNKKVHIFLVAHIRKTDREVILPDLNDVKGTSALVNIAKNVLIVLRTDKLDKSTRSYESLKKLVKLNNYDLDEADCLVKVAKTKGRKLGFSCLKYNTVTNAYYEMKKLDEGKPEPEKAVVAPASVQVGYDDFIAGGYDSLFDEEKRDVYKS